jgi:hypothetical protein
MNDPRTDPARDPRLARAIIDATGAGRFSADNLRALQDRITRAARPRLAEQREARPSWLDYATAWSRTIVPIGVATALVAASCLVWLSMQPREPRAGTVEHVAMLGAATNAVTSGDLVDLAISDVDMPAPPRAPKARVRGR